MESDNTCARVIADVRKDDSHWIISMIVIPASQVDKDIECECMERDLSSTATIPHTAGRDAWLQTWETCQKVILRPPYEYISWAEDFIPGTESLLTGSIRLRSELP